MSFQVIENIKKVTPLGAFCYQALLLETYGKNLEWEEKTRMTWCLRCTHKKKKEYTENVERIFKDYSLFKKKENKKKSKPDGDKSLRTNLLNAIKKNAYVAIDEERSSNDEKFISFTRRFKTVCARVLRQANVDEAQLMPDEGMELDISFVPQDGQSNINEPEPLDTLVHSLSSRAIYGEMFTTPMEESPDSHYSHSIMEESPDLEDPYVDNSSDLSLFSELEFSDVEPHDDQFCLPIEDEDESIFLSNNNYMVIETDDQPQKITGGLKGSHT